MASQSVQVQAIRISGGHHYAASKSSRRSSNSRPALHPARRSHVAHRPRHFSESMAARKDEGGPITRARAHKAQNDTATTTTTKVEAEVVDPPGSKSPPRVGGFTLFGVKPTPEVSAIMLVYFVQGIIGLARLATSFYLKDDLGLTPAEVTYITSAASIPWLIKPLYGFLSDSVPILGYRRRSYLLLCGALGSMAWGALATVVDSPAEALAATVVSSLAIAVSDVVVDSIVVERARGEPAGYSGSLQSLCWGTAAFGGIVSAYFSGSLVQDYGPKTVFAVTALLPLLTMVAAPLVKEQRLPSRVSSGMLDSMDQVKDDFKAQTVRLWGAVKQPAILLPTAFVFLWQATPNPSSAMFFFQTNQLGFTPEFLGRVSLVSSISQLIGVGVYNKWIQDLPLRKVFLFSAAVGTTLGLTQLILVTGYNRELGISDQWFVLGDSVVLTVLGQVAFMPVLVLAAKICPEGVEATLFAALMSILNAGGVSSGIMGGYLTEKLGVTSDNFDNLFWLVLICNMSSLAPLPFLRLLPEDGSTAEAADAAAAATESAGKES